MRTAVLRLTATATAVAALTALASTTGTADTTSATAAADTYGNAGSTSTNYGTSHSLASSSGTTTYLRFPVPVAPAGQSLTRATLTVTTTTLASAGSLAAHSIRVTPDSSWTETALTWNNRPSVGTTTVGSLNIPNANTTATAQLDTAALARVAGTTITVAINSASSDTLWLWSREETAARRPALTLTYTAGVAPTPTAVPSPAVTPAPVPSPIATLTPTPVPSPIATPTPTPTATVGVRNLAFGDSIVEGCCGTTTGQTISETWAATLGWQPPIIKGSGGTGYLTGGSVAGRVPYTQRIGTVLDANPNLDVLVIEGGGNDPADDLIAFRNAVRTTYSIAKQKAPTTSIYVLGPYNPSGSGYATKRAVIEDEARAAGFPYIDQTEWMKGWPDRLHTDNFHPNAAGHAMLGRRVAGELALAGAPVTRTNR